MSITDHPQFSWWLLVPDWTIALPPTAPRFMGQLLLFFYYFYYFFYFVLVQQSTGFFFLSFSSCSLSFRFVSSKFDLHFVSLTVLHWEDEGGREGMGKRKQRRITNRLLCFPSSHQRNVRLNKDFWGAKQQQGPTLCVEVEIKLGGEV